LEHPRDRGRRTRCLQRDHVGAAEFVCERLQLRRPGRDASTLLLAACAVEHAHLAEVTVHVDPDETHPAPPSMLVDRHRGGGGRSDKDGYVLAAHPGQSQGRPKTTSSSQLIVSSGLPCHAPPKSPETRKTQPRLRSGRRSRDDISYPDNALA